MFLPWQIDIEANMVYHEVLNKYYGQYVPHEYFFIQFLLKKELAKNKELAERFYLYVLQYNSFYNWIFVNPQDIFATVVIECAYHDYQFQQFLMGIKTRESIGQSMTFGDIVTEFLIRFCRYNFIG